MSNLGKHIAGVRARREARKVRVMIDLSLPGMDPRAPALWCIAAAVQLMKLRRLRIVEEYERRRGWTRLTLVRSAPRAPALVQLWRVALPGLALPTRANVIVADTSAGGMEVPGAFSRTAAAVGRCLRYGLTRFDPLALRGENGVKILGALQKQVGQSEEARLLVVMQARMLRWGRPKGHGTLSGKTKEPLGVVNTSSLDAARA